MTVPGSVTGANPFDIPVKCSDASHIDGVIDGGIYNDATLATPGFGVNQRALLTGLDIYGACTADGATAAECNQNADFTNPNVTSTPEPGTFMLLAGIVPVLVAVRRARGSSSR